MLKLTATELPRFMQCNGSISMKVEQPDIEKDTTVRDEGIAAHWLVEQVAKGEFSPEELVDRQAPNGVFITGEMIELLEDYIEAVIESEVKVEHDTTYANEQFRINGRADFIKEVNGKYLVVGDLKYGWSIVEPEMNWTLISHAIGYMQRSGFIPREVCFSVWQPRPHHIHGTNRTWTITKTQLLTLQSDLIRALTEPKDELKTGPECRNCPALHGCPAARKAQYNIIDASEKVFTDVLTSDQLSYQIDELKRAGEMLKNLEKAYAELAQHRIKKGDIVKNYSLDNQLTNRQWKKGITPEIIEGMTGKDLTKKQLITPKQAEKAGVSEAVVAAFTERVNKGVKLVRIDANTKANKMFNNN